MAFTTQILTPVATIDYTPSSAASAGGVVVQGQLVGVLPSDLAANEKGALVIMGEVEFPKGTGAGTDYSVGTIVYWDAVNAVITNSSGTGANKIVGVVTQDTTTTDDTVRVWMSPPDQASA